MTYTTETLYTDGHKTVRDFESLRKAVAVAKEECRWEGTISATVYDDYYMSNGDHLYYERGDYAP